MGDQDDEGDDGRKKRDETKCVYNIFGSKVKRILLTCDEVKRENYPYEFSSSIS